MSLSPIMIAGVALVAIVGLVIALVLSRIKVAGPNEAFIVTGAKGKAGEADLTGQKVVTGASVFVIPFIQRLGVLDLSSRRIRVVVPAAVSANGIRCSLEAVAVVKVGGSAEMIRAAAQRFLGQQGEIDSSTSEVLAGSLRAIVGRLTVEEIIRDRAAFATAVQEEAETSLTSQGLALDALQLQDIQTEGNYLQDLGRPEAARAAKEAAVAEAQNRREAEQARLAAEEQIAAANRELALRVAEIRAQTDAAEADAAAAGPIAKAAKDQEILTAEEAVAEKRAALTEKQLDTDVRRPADAARYAAEQEAAAFKAREIAEAEAQAEKTRLSGAAQRASREALAAAARTEGMAESEVAAERIRQAGLAERDQRAAIAEATRAEGVADAEAILARGNAEAEAMTAKAEAYKLYGEAAVVDIVAGVLPQVVSAAAEPMSRISNMTVISTDGASSTVKSVASTLAQSAQMTKDLVGLDLADMIGKFATSATAGGEAGRSGRSNV